MNKYESVIIVNPSVDEDNLKALEKQFTDIINTNGNVTKVDEMGKKTLAYEVKGNTEGIYVTFYFEADPSLITELERNYRITDDVIKFIVINKSSYVGNSNEKWSVLIANNCGELGFGDNFWVTDLVCGFCIEETIKEQERINDL